MFISSDINLNNFFESLKTMSKSQLEDVMLVAATPTYSRLTIQPLVRVADGKCVTFLALRDIEIRPSARGQGHFKKIFELLENLPIPVIFDDVVNSNLELYLRDVKGLKPLYGVKNGYSTNSYYRM